MKRFLKNVAVFGLCGLFSLSLAASKPVPATIEFSGIAPQGLFGLLLNPLVDGEVCIDFDPDEGISYVDLKVVRLKPCTTYSVMIEGSGSGGVFPNAFTTNVLGRASWSFELFGQVTSDSTVQIFRWDGDIETLDVISPIEARAVAVHRWWKPCACN